MFLVGWLVNEIGGRSMACTRSLGDLVPKGWLLPARGWIGC
jgi:hypothetical protein